MPGKLSPSQEKYWKESKEIIKDETGKPQKKLKERDWATIMKIYKNKANKHLGKGKWKAKKKKKSDFALALIKFANGLDAEGLFLYADSVDAYMIDLISVENFGDNNVE